MALPGFAPKQQRIALTHGLKEMRANVIVPERPGPASVGEAALSIFLCATRRLDDIVQRHKLSYHDVSHDYFPIRIK